MSRHKPSQSAAAAALVAAGVPWRKAARDAGVSVAACQDACRRLGILSPNSVGRPRTRLPDPEPGPIL